MKRILAALLIALLCVGLLVGCSGAQTSATEAAQTQSEESSNTTTYADDYDDNSTHYTAPSESANVYDYSDDSDEITYICNKNTKKFHYPDCASVKQMKEKNKLEVTWSRAEVIAKGYDPCHNCNP